MSLNGKNIVVLKNVRDKKQLFHLARNVYSEDSDGLYMMYQNATERPPGYLLLDLSQETDDRRRFRT